MDQIGVGERMSNELARPAQQTGATDGTVVSDTRPQAALQLAVSPAAPGARRPGGRRYRTSQSRGRRYRADRPPAAAARPAEQLPRAEIPSFPSLASTRRTLARTFAVCLVSGLLAAWLHVDLIAGLGFCAACVLATRYCKPQAQLPVVLSIPAIFLATAVVVAVVTSGGGSAHRTILSVFVGTVLTLAALAPWLFAGTAVALAIALFRGLPKCVRDLRAEASGDGLRPRTAADAAVPTRRG